MYPDALCRAVIIKAAEDYFNLLAGFIPPPVTIATPMR